MIDKKASGVPRPRTQKDAERDNKSYTFLTDKQIKEALDRHDNLGSSKKQSK